MPGQRRASPVPQQPARTVEERCDPFNSVDTDAPGGEFECKGNSVEFAADLANNRRVGVIQLEPTVRSGALNKQLYRRKGQRLSSRQRFIIRREGQWIQSMDLLALDLQWFPACRQDMDLWSFPEDALRQWSDRLDRMLPAIDPQQHPPVAQESG